MVKKQKNAIGQSQNEPQQSEDGKNNEKMQEKVEEKKYATGVLKNPSRFSMAQSIEQLGESVRKFLSHAFIKTRNTTDKGLNCYDDCKKELQIKKEQAVEFVRHNPKQSAVLAAGIGAAVFLLVLTAMEKNKRR